MRASNSISALGDVYSTKYPLILDKKIRPVYTNLITDGTNNIKIICQIFMHQGHIFIRMRILTYTLAPSSSRANCFGVGFEIPIIQHAVQYCITEVMEDINKTK